MLKTGPDMELLKTQLLVIGAGPGGYAAAFHAADLGVEVTCVDPEKNPGGVCLYRGCIPSKTLLHVARIISETKEAKEFGVEFGEPRVDLEGVRQWKDKVVSKLTGGLGQLSKQRKVRFIQGRASFLSSRSVTVAAVDGSAITIEFERAIIATGSVPITLPFAPASPRILDSTSALALPDIPKKFLVIGGGYIGLELGTVYAQLGSAVSVVEMTAGLLPGVDADLSALLKKKLASQFEAIKLNTRVSGLKDTGEAVEVLFEDREGQASSEFYDKVLIAIGRKPDASGLGLEHTQVQLTDRGFVAVKAAGQTHDPAIYAIGDMAGNPMLAHKASHEGRAAAGAVAGQPAGLPPKAIPAVVFTDPEIAWCGITESQAVEQGLPVRVLKFPWAASGRAVTLNRTDGLTKLIADDKTGRLLGMAIAGVGAGEMIAEGVLAIEMGAAAADLKASIHPHPTLSETVMEAAETFFGPATHIYKPPRRPPG